MRKYLLTSQERQLIRKYLEKEEKLEGYAMLLSRCRQLQNVKEDLQIIERFLKKVRKIG